MDNKKLIYLMQNHTFIQFILSFVMSANSDTVVPLQPFVEIDCSENDEQACKYCHEHLDKNVLGESAIRPCKCNAYVHKKCLDEWISSRSNVSNDSNESSSSANSTKSNTAAIPIDRCEICESPYSVVKVVTFDRSACCKDVFKVPYVLFSILLTVFAIPFAMFGQSLFDRSDAIIAVVVIVTLFYLPTLVIFLYIIGSSCCDNNSEPFTIRVSPFEYFNSTLALQVATIYYYISLSIIIIQGLGLVIANPILGRPIAFTPTGETFGIMLGITVGAAILVFFVIFVIGQIQHNARTKWIKETMVIVDNPKSDNPKFDNQKSDNQKLNL